MGFDYTCRLTRGVEIFVETVDVFLQKFLGSFFFLQDLRCCCQTCQYSQKTCELVECVGLCGVHH